MFNYDSDLLKNIAELPDVPDEPIGDDGELKVLDDLAMHNGIVLGMESDMGGTVKTDNSIVLWGAGCGSAPIPGDIAAKALASFDGIFYTPKPEGGTEAHIYLTSPAVIDRIVVELLAPTTATTYHLYIFSCIGPYDLGKLMIAVRAATCPVETYLNMVGPSPFDAMAFLLWACGDVLHAPSFGSICLIEPLSLLNAHPYSSFKSNNNQSINNRVRDQWFNYLVHRGLLNSAEVTALLTKNQAVFITNAELTDRTASANEVKK